MVTVNAFERLIDKLRADGRKVQHVRAGQAVAQCPGHDDRTPSLSIHAIEGRALLHCFAGCNTAHVLAALGWTMADLFDEPRGTAYTYRDGKGQVTRTVHRTPDKKFRQAGDTQSRPSLYRLPEVLAAVAAGRTIYLTEGEQDVLALESLGEIATTNPMGSANWAKVDASPLHDAHIVAVPDDDAAGHRWAKDVYASLAGRAASLTWRKAKVGKDAADHVAAGHGVAELVEIEPPGGEPEDGAALLDAVEQFLGRFVAYPSEAARIAHTLWVGHCWFMDVWESTPRLAFLSPEPGSGKTRALEVTEPLVPRPIHAVNATPAFLFRKVSDEAGPPTILYDEIDTVFGPRAKDNEEVRGMLNAGHRRGAVAGRCVMHGKTVVTEELPAYCAVALAGLNDLPDTIRTRSVIVHMRRRGPHETVEPWRNRLNGPEGAAIAERLSSWAQREAGRIVWPELPAGIEDRNADVWEPLLAVADLAGGEWPARGRVAAVTLVTDLAEGKQTLGVQLLADLRAIFGDRDAVSTEELLTELVAIEESPWSDLRGKPLDARGLGQRLRRFDVKSTTVRTHDGVFKGYRSQGLHDAWERYLPARPEKSVTGVTTVTARSEAADFVTDSSSCNGKQRQDEPLAVTTAAPTEEGQAFELARRRLEGPPLFAVEQPAAEEGAATPTPDCACGKPLATPIQRQNRRCNRCQAAELARRKSEPPAAVGQPESPRLDWNALWDQPEASSGHISQEESPRLDWGDRRREPPPTEDQPDDSTPAAAETVA